MLLEYKLQPEDLLVLTNKVYKDILQFTYEEGSPAHAEFKKEFEKVQREFKKQRIDLEEAQRRVERLVKYYRYIYPRRFNEVGPYNRVILTELIKEGKLYTENGEQIVFYPELTFAEFTTYYRLPLKGEKIKVKDTIIREFAWMLPKKCRKADEMEILKEYMTLEYGKSGGWQITEVNTAKILEKLKGMYDYYSS